MRFNSSRAHHMKSLVLFLTLLFPAGAGAIEHQPGVLRATVNEVEAADKKFGLPVRTWLGFLSGNDEIDQLHRAHRRSTLIFHHEEPSAQKHHIIYWFHGMGGYHNFSDNMFPQIRELVARRKSFTIVEPEMPWSCNASRIDGRQSWSKLGSFKVFADAATKQTPPPRGKEIVLVVGGHSRGGKGIRDALSTGGLCDMVPDWVIWSDATYSEWFDKSWASCLKSVPERIEVFYIKGTSTGAFISRLRDNQHFPFVHLNPLGLPWYHGKVGNNALLLSKILK